MNKTISVNIAGFVFNIEEQAYEKLKNYLKSIRTKFSNEKEQDEIMEDIEARVAELFHEKLSTIKQVIVGTDVDEVMDIMGRPEDYVGDEEESAESEKNASTQSDGTYYDKTSKRLFRDEELGSVGGVCAGLGHYFNVDVVIFRVLFVLLVMLGGSGALIYIILWIAVPEAKTTADKLQMKGHRVNLDNIKEHFSQFKESTEREAKNAEKGIKRAVNQTVKGASGFLQYFGKFLGVAFILGGIFALLILITIFFGGSGLLPIVGSEQIEDLPTMIEIIYPGDTQHTFIFLAMMLVTMIPMISIIITGVRLLIDQKKPYKPLAITGLIIWIVSVGVMVITGIELGMNFRSQTEIEYEVPLKNPNTDVLYLDVSKDKIFSDHISYHHVWNFSELIKVEDEQVYMGFPQLRIIQKEDSSNFEVTLYVESQGLSTKDAINKAEDTQYDLQVKGNKLWLPPYYSFSRSSKLRGQLPTVEILVPLGKKVRFGKNIDRIGIQIEGQNYHHHDHHSYADSEWVSEYDGFDCLDCSPNVKRVYGEEIDEQDEVQESDTIKTGPETE